MLIPASRLHRSPCLGYRRRPVDDGPDPFERVEAAAGAMARDLEAVARDRPRWGPPAVVQEGDARTAVLPKGRIDLAITSPPYVNGMDYVMNYKLDLAWLGYANSYADLAELRRREVACDNLPRSDPGLAAGSRTDLDPWLPPILREIRTNVARKGSYRRDDMDSIVYRYFADLVPVLENVRRSLRPRARWIVVVGDSLLAGTYVPGDLLLARMARRRGFRILGIEVARVRRSGQRRSFALRESIVTLERAGDG
ncbi:modification methylase [mine drainage metagenome]|uniref:site-specific DNA-methyltransferase (cytosine-N(4)-specific) n=1 Tax=mine drainage metagenome TaxID=410659 RepID=T1BY60_9ZZZZ